MLFEELLEEIKKLSWIRIIQSGSGILKGKIINRNSKKTDFSLIIEGTCIQLVLGGKEGGHLIEFISEEMNIPYLQVISQCLLDFFNKTNIYMWEENDRRFKKLYDDFSLIIENSKTNIFGYKHIHILVPDSHKRRSL